MLLDFLHHHVHVLDELAGGGHQLVHDGVVLDEGDVLAVLCDKVLNELRRFERTAEFEGLGGIQQLDGKNLLHVLHHLVGLGRGVGAHAHVILLPLRRLDGVGG